MACITFHGRVLHTNGNLPAVGATAPGFSLANSKLQDMSLADFAGQKKLLNIVPSLDSPVCAASARTFNQKAGAFSNVAFLVISADLPFAQVRFCESEGLNNLLPLSTMRSGFATDYGVMIIDGILAGLTARAVIIIDENDKIRYTQLVGEVTQEPDYQSVLAVL